MKRWTCCKCKASDVIVGAPPPSMNGDDLKEKRKTSPEEKIETEEEEESLYYISAEESEEEDDTVPLLTSADTVFFFDAAEVSVSPSASQHQSTTENEHSLSVAPSTSQLKSLRRQETPKEDELLLAADGKRVPRSSEEWGFPGYLTPHQLAAFQDFRSQVIKRGGAYKEMVYCYREIEEEAYALCRFLRWANFHVDKVFRYMDQHVEQWNEAKSHDFYPNAGVGDAPLSVLLTQFPSVYTGFSKDGFPVCYVRSGNLSAEGIDCVTDVERLPNFIWYTMRHEMPDRYAEAMSRHPELKRMEQITVMNLDGLSPKLLTPRIHAVSQQVDAVAQAFPEMMFRLVIINAPRFFTYVWNSFKVLLDSNTTKRIELYSSRERSLERLLQLIDPSELPSDYGGSGLSTSQAILREGRSAGAPVPLRQVVELLKIKRKSEFEFELQSEEEISIAIYTRSDSRTEFVLRKNEADDHVLKEITIEQTSEKSPRCIHFVEAICGPGEFSIVGQHSQGFSSAEYFLVVGEVFPTKETKRSSKTGMNGNRATHHVCA